MRIADAWNVPLPAGTAGFVGTAGAPGGAAIDDGDDNVNLPFVETVRLVHQNVRSLPQETIVGLLLFFIVIMILVFITIKLLQIERHLRGLSRAD